MRVAVLPLLALLALPACRTETSSEPASAPGGVVAQAEPKRAWRVLEAGELVGWVVHFQDPDDERRSFFSVRDAHHHELGLIDHHGRWWRYRAHAPEAEWLGSGTVLEGAARILGAGPEAALIEVPAAPAGPDRPPGS